MNSTQKVIKYAAMAFGLFLAINIIFGIVSAAVSLIGVVTFSYHEDKDQEKIHLVNFEESYTDIQKLAIEIGVANFNIEEGDTFTVEAKNVSEGFYCKNENGTLVLRERRLGNNFINDVQVPKITITIPKDTVFQATNIQTGVGSNKIDVLTTETLDMNIGVGKLKANHVTAKNSATITGGVGKVEFENATLHDTKINTGVGEFTINGVITGNSKIQCGVGKVEVDIQKPLENYTITSNSGLGGVYINREKVEKNSTTGNGTDRIQVEGGIGRVDLTFHTVNI